MLKVDGSLYQSKTADLKVNGVLFIIDWIVMKSGAKFRFKVQKTDMISSLDN